MTPCHNIIVFFMMIVANLNLESFTKVTYNPPMVEVVHEEMYALYNNGI